MSRFESAISDQERDRRLIRVQQAIRKTPKSPSRASNGVDVGAL
jgi:hypothetical protein